MENTNANDLVNPSFINNGPDDWGYTHSGLTKREYFAAMAMQGLLANTQVYKNMNLPSISELAIKQADGLIAELNKPITK